MHAADESEKKGVRSRKQLSRDINRMREGMCETFDFFFNFFISADFHNSHHAKLYCESN
jgi:hypothetical protein